MNKKKPNVLFLFSDQHSARTLGCYGNDEIRTPYLDKLASKGALLTNTYCNNPICTPSRMCFLSGQYPHNHGHWGLMGPNPDWLPSAFSHFKQSGYLTGWAGKSHTPSGWLSPYSDQIGDGYGFEKRISNSDTTKMVGLQGVQNNDYSFYLAQKGLLHLRDDRVLQEQYQLFGHSRGQGVDARPSRLSEEDSIEAWSAREAIKMIDRSQKEEKPFFFWMTMPRPHQGYTPAERFWNLYNENELTLPPNCDDPLEGRHPLTLNSANYYREHDDWRLFEPKSWNAARKRVLRGYYGCVSQVDAACGVVLDYLEENGLTENTIIVYSSDHGEFAGEHGMIEKAPGIGFRCITRIPFIVSYPGVIPDNVRREEIAESVDFLPTICSLAGLPMPNWCDGEDISKLLINGEKQKEFAVTEHPLSKTIHNSRYKFTSYLPEMDDGKDFGELYDMIEDPWEMNNLYYHSQYASIVSKLEKELYYWLVRTTRSITINPIPYVFRGKNNNSWDLAEQLYDEDGRVGKNYLKHVMESKPGYATAVNPRNYL